MSLKDALTVMKQRSAEMAVKAQASAGGVFNAAVLWCQVCGHGRQGWFNAGVAFKAKVGAVMTVL